MTLNINNAPALQLSPRQKILFNIGAFALLLTATALTIMAFVGFDQVKLNYLNWVAPSVDLTGFYLLWTINLLSALSIAISGFLLLKQRRYSAWLLVPLAIFGLWSETTSLVALLPLLFSGVSQEGETNK
ncbi:hypothetical protein [Thalassolituus hydrocarboniclasticus]|jgi:hypothetical protein|uniref:Uncharacterized protein n=1 Tax=Thalassolituus hydrocarboniclasticus TaxID=2742796 RepID=A0ABY6ACW5_9GAMM|nr:hypothetical protein [Thalassolituus hydrocarboniclasticus]UXD87804.1 hypothetical protein HUF19_10310 [Thalassolituus hydrocarboniclasticus]